MEKNKIINEVTSLVQYYESLNSTSRHGLISRLVEMGKFNDGLLELNDSDLVELVFDLTTSVEEKELFKQNKIKSLKFAPDKTFISLSYCLMAFNCFKDIRTPL